MQIHLNPTAKRRHKKRAKSRHKPRVTSGLDAGFKKNLVKSEAKTKVIEK